MSTLSPEIVSLVHHIALHESSWWDEAVDRIALSCLLASRRPLDIESIIQQMRAGFGLHCDTDEVATALLRLESSGKAVLADQHRYTASQEARNDAAAAAADAKALAMRVESQFTARVHSECGQMTPCPEWASFRDECLLPLLSQEGAQAAALSLGGAGNGGFGEIVSAYVDQHDPDGTAGLAACVQSFLLSGDDAVREYVLRQLDAQFIVAAARLDSDTIKALTASKSVRPSLRLALDTNFLFSVLGWHDHPSNEAAQAVLDIAASSDSEVDIELVVLPTTLEETENAILLKAERLQGIRWTTGLAEAAMKFGAPGFVSQYLRVQADTGYPMSIVDYADLVAHDLENRLQQLGVTVVDDDLSGYGMNQDVIDNISDLMSYENEHRAKADRRDYQIVKHDMIAYQWVADRRPAQLKTAVDAGYWLVTLDFRLLAFDRYRCRGRAKAQVCLHPSTAVQFLQFWVPTNEALRLAIFSNVRQPLFPATSLAETERMTFKIVERLSQLRGIEDVSSDAIRDALADKVLRSRMRLATDQDEEIALIEEAFVRIASEAEERLSAQLAKTTALESELEKSQEEIRRHREFEEGRKIQADKLKRQAEAAETEVRKLEVAVDKQTKAVETISARLDEAEGETARLRWLWWWVVVPGFASLIFGAGVAAAAVAYVDSSRRLVPLLLLVALVALVFMAVVAYSYGHVPAAQESSLARRLAKLNSWVWGVAITGVVLGFVGSMLYDMVSR